MSQASILAFSMLVGGALIAMPAAAAAAGDAARGQELYVKCERCHVLDPEGSQEEGPHLHGIFGRKAGTVETYPGYSEAMKESEVVWTEETIDEYLKKPKAFIEGTNMRFRTMRKEQDRQDLIAYLLEATQ